MTMDISVAGISKTYAAGNKALDEVTFDFHLNGIFSLIGKNGRLKVAKACCSINAIEAAPFLPMSEKMPFK